MEEIFIGGEENSVEAMKGANSVNGDDAAAAATRGGDEEDMARYESFDVRI